MCSKTVPEGVATGGFRNTGLANGELDGILQVLLGNMVPAELARPRVLREFGGWKDVLPRPGAIGVAVFAFQGKRQIDSAAAACEIALVECTYVREMQLERPP